MRYNCADMNISSHEKTWSRLVAQHNGHLLQSWAWGRLKSRFGWTPVQLHTEYAAAQVLFRKLPLGYSVAYIPKGPLVNWKNSQQCEALLELVDAEARKRKAVFLKIEPDLNEVDDDSPPTAELFTPATSILTERGFIAADTIQPQSSIIVDISGSEDDILAAMKQKTRYNIRLATKRGVTTRQGTEADLAIFYSLTQLTAKRDGFGVHASAYYQTAMQLFDATRCALLLAEFEGEPLAALMAFRQGATAYYFYGASSNAYRKLMPAYLLQWEAMRWAKAQGCTHYDLWGIPTANKDTLEAEFSSRSDGLWGVYRFKRGFGGQVVHSLGAFDLVYIPWLYRLYSRRRGVTS